MKIGIYGAGAIGGYLGAKLALAGEDVTLIARGAHLAAIKKHGLGLVQTTKGVQYVPVKAVATTNEAGKQDTVIMALKANALPGVVAQVGSLLDTDTMVVTAQNGLPWWYFYQNAATPQYEGRIIEAVDPGGEISNAIGFQRAVGCVVYPAAEVLAPGVIRHLDGDRFSLGEPDGTKSERVRALAQIFNNCGLKSPVRNNIRAEIWVKLWGNCAFNPISAITRATLAQICSYAPIRQLAYDAMSEAYEIATKLGIDFGVTIEQRIDGAEKVGEHKTSMLQDVEAGKPTEIEALVGAVLELGRLTNIPTPTLQMLYASVTLLEKQLQAAK